MPHTVIIGAGVIGVSTAYFLSHAPSRDPGHKITILDQSPPASGASGKAGGLIAPRWVESPTASLENLSFRLHQELAVQYGGAEKWGYRRCRLLGGMGGDGEPDDIVDAKGWRARRNVSKLPDVDENLRWIKPGALKRLKLLSNEKQTAQCEPYQFTTFLLNEAKSKGVALLMGSVSSLTVESGRVTHVHAISLDGCALNLLCDSVILAAGPWTGPLSMNLFREHIPVYSLAGHSVVLHPSIPAGAECLFGEFDHGTCQPEFYTKNSGEIYIGGVNDNLVLPKTPEDAVPMDKAIDKLMDIASTFLVPGYTFLKSQLCFRPVTERGTPFVGAVPGVQGVYVGAGHSFYGIMLAPGTGKVLSEMVLGLELSADVSQLAVTLQPNK